ncbi:tetratricopeptide repeat protein [Xanthovirga aplysinae]|uniref:tetratricopeptide repeat protein n=1 Tax=Xanthovirga aplysinae TaxID=2529853 RepID=UPI0012BB4F41|nr:tetratricopeptide repeat protein [Xanthovirga aplysinae]MTI30981.1 tetratricopeptide repeat protein [Xanthovirga aplysinae]
MKKIILAVGLFTSLLVITHCSYSSPTFDFKGAYELAKENAGNKPELAIKVGKKLLEEAEKADNIEYQVNALKVIGYSYNVISDFQSALEYFNRARSLNTDKKEEAKLLHNLGWVHRSAKNYEDALEFFIQANKLWEKSEMDFQAPTLNNLGLVYYELEDIPNAKKYLQEALRVSKKHNNSRDIVNSTIALGWFYLMTNNLDLAKDKTIEGLNILDTIKSYSANYVRTDALNNLGAIEKKLGDLDEAYNTHLKAFNLAVEVGIDKAKLEASTALKNISYAKNDLKQYKLYSDYELALTKNLDAQKERFMGYLIEEKKNEKLLAEAQVEKTELINTMIIVGVIIFLGLMMFLAYRYTRSKTDSLRTSLENTEDKMMKALENESNLMIELKKLQSEGNADIRIN